MTTEEIKEAEEWRDVVGYEGYYRVSSFGRVMGIDRTIRNSKGLNVSIRGRFLNAHIGPTGYYRQPLSKNGIARFIPVHRLVASAFIENPENKPCVNHKDSNRLNNNVLNLEWMTGKENIIHGFKYGFISRVGEKNSLSKLTEADVKKIRTIYPTGKYSQRQLAKIYNVRQQNILAILKRRSWTHI